METNVPLIIKIRILYEVCKSDTIMMHFEVQMLDGKHVIIDQLNWKISQFNQLKTGMITRLKLTKDGKTDFYGGEIIELTQINENDGILKMIERPNMHLHDPSKSK